MSEKLKSFQTLTVRRKIKACIIKKIEMSRSLKLFIIVIIIISFWHHILKQVN